MRKREEEPRERRRAEQTGERGQAPLPAAVLALQRSIGNRETTELLRARPSGGPMLQRKLDGTLRGDDAKIRLQHLLSKPGKSKFGPRDNSAFERIVNSDEVYDWERIETEFGPFEENLGGYVQSGTRQVTLYRADGRPPDKLKASNPPGFGVRISVPFGLLKAALLKDVNSFAEDQVRQNRQDLKSYATDTGAGGYASGDRPLYEIDFGQWYEFKKPATPGKLSSAIILADQPNLADATKIAIDTQKATNEIFLLFEVGLTDITSVRKPGSSTMERIDWNAV